MDIREKVALAILHAHNDLDCGRLKPKPWPGQIWMWEDVLADAALLACDYQKMREALEHQRQRTMPDGTPCFCQFNRTDGGHYSWCKEARSALGCSND